MAAVAISPRYRPAEEIENATKKRARILDAGLSL
jgi:hypothetical protein